MNLSLKSVLALFVMCSAALVLFINSARPETETISAQTRERIEWAKQYASRQQEFSVCACPFCCGGSGKCMHCSGQGKINVYIGPSVEAHSGEELMNKTKGMYKEEVCGYCDGSGICPICGGKGYWGTLSSESRTEKRTPTETQTESDTDDPPETRWYYFWVEALDDWKKGNNEYQKGNLEEAAIHYENTYTAIYRFGFTREISSAMRDPLRAPRVLEEAIEKALRQGQNERACRLCKDLLKYYLKKHRLKWYYSPCDKDFIKQWIENVEDQRAKICE
jgi:hypothetical protein